MIKNFFKIFFGNLFGKIIGFVREIITAYFYGTTFVIASFRVSQTALLIPINFFTTDILNAGFIPLFNKYKKENIKKASSFFWLVKFILIFLSVILIFLVFIFGKKWLNIIAPGFNEKEIKIAFNFLKIMSVSIPFYLLSTLYSFLAMSYDKYFLVSVRPIVQSVGIIISVICAYYLDDILFLAYGFAITYILFYFFTFLHVKSFLKFYFFNVKTLFFDLFHSIKPLLLLPFFLQGNILIERAIASLISVSTVAAVDYAKFISESGVVLLAAPLGLIGLTKFSVMKEDVLKENLIKIINVLLIITIPVSTFIICYSDFIIKLIFERGAFNLDSVNTTSMILMGLGIGFWAQVVSYILIKSLNAQRKNKIVLIFMVIALVINSLFNVIFYKLLGSLTIGIGASIYGIVLFILLIKYFGIFNKISRNFIKLFIYSFLIGVSGFYLKKFDIYISIVFFLIYWGILVLLDKDIKEKILILRNRN